ncbi:MAG: Ribosomal RNA small subunit methyltransferase A [Chlamydiae bacterium]|nr:Ribosomal RNA small subunit methyltransferase A [Chlamydiota bacterium]
MTYRPSQLRTLLKENHLFPKKRLSQTFIIDGNIVRKVVEEAAVSPGDRVLEIGPGPGAFTEVLLEKEASVIAVEKDPAYARLLVRLEKLEIFEGDIRDFPLERAANAKIVANLPFNITTPILALLIPRSDLFTTATFIVQEEVARRIVATPGSPHYSSLSLFVRFYTNPTYAFSISRRSFYPVPRVDSAVVKLTLRPPPEVDSPAHFFILVRTAFKQRRKMLRSSLKELYPACDSDKRPEELSLEDFISLYNFLK